MSLNFLSQFSLQVRNDSCCFLKQSYTKVMDDFFYAMLIQQVLHPLRLHCSITFFTSLSI
jgi:hypothetical protein